MKKISALLLIFTVCLCSSASYAGLKVTVNVAPDPCLTGQSVAITAIGSDFKYPLDYAQITIKNANQEIVVNKDSMTKVSDTTFEYQYQISSGAPIGEWYTKCEIWDTHDNQKAGEEYFNVTEGGGNPHASIQEYTGPETCVACHQTQAEGMFSSVHYQWIGPTPDVPNISGDAGKVNAFNTYCGNAITNPWFDKCIICHAGYGKVPSSMQSPEQLSNIDCLKCHHEDYERKLAGPFTTDGPFYQECSGEWVTWNIPVTDPDGSIEFMPDESKMPITILEAAQNPQLPTRKACLKCHAKAGGGDGVKRGDFSLTTIDPPIISDYHMSCDGANLKCQSCHQFINHKVKGRGMDLRPNDTPERLTCTNCHENQTHSQNHVDNHLDKVACQSCHIPTYAKDTPTITSKNWTQPGYSATGWWGQPTCGPSKTTGSNLIPIYEWLEPTNEVYILDQQIIPTNGKYVLSVPSGGRISSEAKVTPMKVNESTGALHNESGKLIPQNVYKFWQTGDFADAVQEAMAQLGWTGTWSEVELKAYQLITHGVEPKGNALACNDCHSGTSGQSTGTRMPFDELGYHEFRGGGRPQLCSGACHSIKTEDDRVELHNSHRSKTNCALSCHGPEPTRSDMTQPDPFLCKACHQPRTYEEIQWFHNRHKGKKVTCTACHGNDSPLIETVETLCDNCHSMKTEGDLFALHNNHYDPAEEVCRNCHLFADKSYVDDDLK